LTGKGTEDRGAFDSIEDLGELLQIIAARLHAKNRIWLGEQHYVWELACLIDRIGGGMVPLIDDAAIRAEFGSAYGQAGLDPAAQRARLIALAFPDPLRGRTGGGASAAAP
jgi:hypothetical protein